MALTSAATRGSVAATTYPAGASSQPIGGASAPPTATSYYGTFIPEIWSGKLIARFYDTTVFGAICNTDYESEIKNYGDKVWIRTRPTVQIHDYTPDSELVVQRPNADTIELVIDKAKYFNCTLDDIYAHQSDIDMMNLWAQDAAEQMKILIDTELLQDVMLGGAAATNKGQTAGRISADLDLGITTAPVALVANNPGTGETSILDLVVAMGQTLDEQNIPEEGRWLVIPPWVASMIKRSELRDASISGDGTSMLRNGRLGRLDRFTLYYSNLLPTGTGAGLVAGETAIFAGHNVATTFASQMTNMGTLQSERTFGTLIRGLQVYGSKVIKPEGLVEAIVAKA